jgi:biotin operon repressor
VASPQFSDIVASLQDRLSRIDAELERGGTSGAAPQRKSPPGRKRANKPRRTRARRGDTQQAVLRYLAEHPGSSASAIADALGFKRNSTSTRLTQMAKAGLIVRSDGRGYEVPSGATAHQAG